MYRRRPNHPERRRQSAVGSRQSAVGSWQSAVGSRQSVVGESGVSRRNGSPRVPRSAFRTAFTLVELMMAMTITAMLSVVLGGLVMAVQTAREHTEGLEEATVQAQVAIDRIKFMVSQTGVYQVSGQPTTLGMAVVSHKWFGVDLLPDVLVVWSGGRNGGMAAAAGSASTGVPQRLPRIDELLIYTFDPQTPTHLVEIAFPGNSDDIDFRDPRFSTRILSLIASPTAEKTLLCDRIRQSDLPQSYRYFARYYGATNYVNIRFELSQTPDDSELQASSPGTPEWYGLGWAQGVVAGDLGMRQATLRMELQIRRDSRPASKTDSSGVSIPFLGSASYRYVYRP